MNSTIYLFGNFENGYTQYPNDNTRSIFQNFITNSKAKTQICVHRSGDLMYYGYVRKLDRTDQKIGICILLNSVMFNKIQPLFTLFENAFQNLVVNGEIIGFDEKGNIISNVGEFLFDKQREIERIAKFIHYDISKLESSCSKLPPINYSIANNETKYFSIDDDQSSIVEASYMYGYTFVYKDENFNAQSFNSYRNVIYRLSESNALLQTQNKELKVAKKQQQNWGVAIFLFVIATIVIIFLISNNFSQEQNYESQIKQVNNQKTELEQSNSTLESEKNSALTAKERAISEKESAESELNKLQSNIDAIKETMPILITNLEVANTYSGGQVETNYGSTIYSRNTMYLKPKIYYSPIGSGSITLYIKLFTSNGTLSTGTSSPSGYSTTSEIYISSSGYSELNGWGNNIKGHWSTGTYRYEIWYKERMLFSKSFTIY